MVKNIIDEGIEDSEALEETSKEYKTSNGVSIKPGDVLQVKSVSPDGEIILIVSSKAKESEENSEGSYRVR
jgi:hypothetical protein